MSLEEKENRPDLPMYSSPFNPKALIFIELLAGLLALRLLTPSPFLNSGFKIFQRIRFFIP